MADSYSSRLRLLEMEVGQSANSWGTKLNDNDIAMIDEAFGMATVSLSSTNLTLSTANGTTDQSRPSILRIQGALTANCAIVIPSLQRFYFVWNDTTGSYNVSIQCASGTGSNVTQGQIFPVVCNGSLVQAIADTSAGFANPMTTRGDLITRNASTAIRLAIGTAGQLLKTDGTDASWGFVSTANIAVDQITTSLVADSAITAVKIAAGAVTGTKISLTSNTDGDMMYYVSSTAAWTRLAAGATNTFLKSGALVPVWTSISAGLLQTGYSVLSSNNTSNTSFVTTGLAVTLTIATTGSKQIININGCMSGSSDGSILFQIKRGSTDISPTGLISLPWTVLSTENRSFSLSVEDTGVSGSQTYTLFFKSNTGSIVNLSTVVMTVLESGV